jgi:hypothetical protein
LNLALDANVSDILIDSINFGTKTSMVDMIGLSPPSIRGRHLCNMLRAVRSVVHRIFEGRPTADGVQRTLYVCVFRQMRKDTCTPHHVQPPPLVMPIRNDVIFPEIKGFLALRQWTPI